MRAQQRQRPRWFSVCSLGIGLGVLAGSVGAEPVEYRFDPTHSFVHFEVLHFGTSTIRGRFGPLAGEAMLDRSARRGRVQLTIDMASASTGVGVLDARMKQADLLGTEAHPKAWFVAEGFDLDAEGRVRQVRGELTLKGVSQPLVLTAERFSCYPSPLFKREVCGGDFSAELQRSHFGMDFGLPLVADAVRLRIQVEAIRQSP